MKLFRFRTLRSRLIVLIGLPLLLLQIAVVWLEYALGRADELAEMKQQFSQVTRLTAAQIDRQLATVAEVARDNAGFLADNPQLNDYERHRLLRRIVADHPSIHGAALAFEPWISHRVPQVYRTGDGQRLETMDLNRPDSEVRRQAWYRRARSETEAFWTEVGFERGGDETAVATCVMPIFRNGGFAGAVTADLALETLRSQFAHSGIPGGHWVLIDGAGSILAGSDGAVPAGTLGELAAKWGQPAYGEIAHRIASGQAGITRISGREKGIPDRWLLHSPIPATGWTLLAAVDEAKALEDVYARLLRQALLYGFGTAGILLLVWWAAVVMTRPLKPLAEAARKVAGGNLDVRVEGPPDDDEIGRFSGIFNQMVADLDADVAIRLSDAAARQAVESELAIGLKIQQSLLPKAFSGHPAIGIAGDFIPARYVAGDFYDWFHVDADTVGLVIADVSGKGVPAALFMAVARTSLRSFGARSLGPAETLTLLNRSLFEDNPLTMFVTLFYGHYHIPTGRLVYANAGHNPPYIVRANGTVESLGDSTGPLLAVFADPNIADAEARLHCGDALVLYTDGVTEASDPDGRLYDEKRLELVLKNTAGETPAAICARITYAVSDHCRGAPQDDVTLLVLRRQV